MPERCVVSSWLALGTAHSHLGPSHGWVLTTVLTTHHTYTPPCAQLDERIGVGGGEGEDC